MKTQFNIEVWLTSKKLHIFSVYSWMNLGISIYPWNYLTSFSPQVWSWSNGLNTSFKKCLLTAPLLFVLSFFLLPLPLLSVFVINKLNEIIWHLPCAENVSSKWLTHRPCLLGCWAEWERRSLEEGNPRSLLASSVLGLGHTSLFTRALSGIIIKLITDE